MGPKRKENSKAVEAREKKEAAKTTAQLKEQKEKEDREWREAGEGAKSKAQLKKKEQDAAREEAAKKKLEAKKLLQEEEASLNAAKKQKEKVALPKVTAFQLQKQKEQEAARAQKEQEAKRAEANRMVTEDDYSRLVETENQNLDADKIEAQNVEAALAALVVDNEVEKHPERRMRAAYEAYAEREMAELKLSKPGLKQSQYKDMIWKSWQKAKDNPMNRVA